MAADDAERRWLYRNGGEPAHNIKPCAFDSSGRFAACASVHSSAVPRSGQTVHLWDLASGSSRSMSLVPPGETASGYEFGVDSLAFAPGRRLVAAGFGGVRILDLDKGKSEWDWRVQKDRSFAMALSGDGRQLVAIEDPKGDGSAPTLVELGAGSRHPLGTHGNRVISLAIDPSGRALVTGDSQGTVRVGTLSGGEPRLFEGHTGPVASVAVSPDGRWIASASGSEIRLWPMPDLSAPPFHTLPHDELMAKLDSLTNLRAVEDEESPTGYSLEVGPFPGWRDVPLWFTPAHPDEPSEGEGR